VGFLDRLLHAAPPAPSNDSPLVKVSSMSPEELAAESAAIDAAIAARAATRRATPLPAGIPPLEPVTDGDGHEAWEALQLMRVTAGLRGRFAAGGVVYFGRQPGDRLQVVLRRRRPGDPAGAHTGTFGVWWWEGDWGGMRGPPNARELRPMLLAAERLL
jgi:hypothetical protein